MGKEDAFGSCRIRTAREKTRAVKHDLEKQLLELGRERNILWRKKQNLGYEPLNPPVQKGFKRFFVLREDVARSPRAGFFQEILDKINTVQYSDTRQFTKTRRFRGRKIKVQREQFLKPLYEYEWQKLRLSPEQGFYFAESEDFTAYYGCRKVWRFIEPWRFRLKIGPNLITQVRIRDADLESQLAEIDNYMERNNLYGKLHNLQHGYSHYRYFPGEEKPKFKNPFKNKPLYQVLEIAEQEEKLS